MDIITILVFQFPNSICPTPNITKRATFNVLMDSAVDEALALPIFRAVSLGKAENAPNQESSSTLQVVSDRPLEVLIVCGAQITSNRDDTVLNANPLGADRSIYRSLLPLLDYAARAASSARYARTTGVCYAR